jgi:FdrA protein
MTVVINEVRSGSYLDSVALMRIAQLVKDLAGVEDCGLMMGTPANLGIMAEAGVLSSEGRRAGPGDLVIAVRAIDANAGQRALAEARAALDRPRAAGVAGAAWTPKTLRSAIGTLPGANIALISVPGAFATAEAMKAMTAGLNVMMFSDNVGIEDEIALKRAASERGLLMMGPDCGTAIIAGTPLAFANEIPRGDIGIIGASGTGIQEVACCIANNGGGISHAIGTGGRDLRSEVGAMTTLQAIDLLEADASTRHVVIVSKPPAPDVAIRVLERAGRSAKSFTICFIGGDEPVLPYNCRGADSLEGAALLALGREAGVCCPSTSIRRAGTIRGLFAGGTLCAEAQVVLKGSGLAVASNIPIAGVVPAPAEGPVHSLLDLGDDAYTVGRPHPMIEPSVRDALLDEAMTDAGCAVVLLDCVLGYGGHLDPAGHLAARLAGRPERGPVIVASITGTEGDPQCLTAQREKLIAAGVLVERSNAAAARLAVAIVTAPDARP